MVLMQAYHMVTNHVISIVLCKHFSLMFNLRFYVIMRLCAHDTRGEKVNSKGSFIADTSGKQYKTKLGKYKLNTRRGTQGNTQPWMRRLRHWQRETRGLTTPRNNEGNATQKESTAGSD